VRCRRDASKRYGDLELVRHAAGAGTWRCRGLEVWRRASGLGVGGVCLKRSGAREVCYGRGDVEAKRYGDLEVVAGV